MAKLKTGTLQMANDYFILPNGVDIKMVKDTPVITAAVGMDFRKFNSSIQKMTDDLSDAFSKIFDDAVIAGNAFAQMGHAADALGYAMKSAHLAGDSVDVKLGGGAQVAWTTAVTGIPGTIDWARMKYVPTGPWVNDDYLGVGPPTQMPNDIRDRVTDALKGATPEYAEDDELIDTMMSVIKDVRWEDDRQRSVERSARQPGGLPTEIRSSESAKNWEHIMGLLLHAVGGSIAVSDQDIRNFKRGDFSVQERRDHRTMDIIYESTVVGATTRPPKATTRSHSHTAGTPGPPPGQFVNPPPGVSFSPGGVPIPSPYSKPGAVNPGAAYPRTTPPRSKKQKF